MSTINPPNDGPKIEKTITASPNNDIASPLFSKGKLSSKIACEIGIIGPPPIPCINRPKTIKFKFGATAQINEPTVKMEIKTFKKFLRPIKFSSQPVIRIRQAFAII